MKRLIVWALLAVLSILPLAACVSSGNAKQQALQALVTTTRAADLLMTAAGIAYNASAFGAPGSAKAEETWDKIARESVKMSAALNSWQSALIAGEDASDFEAIVGQALAVIGSLLPAQKRGAIDMRPLEDPAVTFARLGSPGDYRSCSPATVGGAR